MSQKSSFPQPRQSVSGVLTPDSHGFGIANANSGHFCAETSKLQID